MSHLAFGNKVHRHAIVTAFDVPPRRFQGGNLLDNQIGNSRLPATMSARNVHGPCQVTQKAKQNVALMTANARASTKDNVIRAYTAGFSNEAFPLVCGCFLRGVRSALRYLAPLPLSGFGHASAIGTNSPVVGRNRFAHVALAVTRILHFRFHVKLQWPVVLCGDSYWTSNPLDELMVNRFKWNVRSRRRSSETKHDYLSPDCSLNGHSVKVIIRFMPKVQYVIALGVQNNHD
jgi:hypothetical protein